MIAQQSKRMEERGLKERLGYGCTNREDDENDATERPKAWDGCQVYGPWFYNSLLAHKVVTDSETIQVAGLAITANTGRPFDLHKADRPNINCCHHANTQASHRALPLHSRVATSELVRPESAHWFDEEGERPTPLTWSTRIPASMIGGRRSRIPFPYLDQPSRVSDGMTSLVVLPLFNWRLRRRAMFLDLFRDPTSLSCVQLQELEDHRGKPTMRRELLGREKEKRCSRHNLKGRVAVAQLQGA